MQKSSVSLAGNRGKADWLYVRKWPEQRHSTYYRGRDGRPENHKPMSHSPRYKGNPFKSGACGNCSGNPPAMCINAMTSKPAHPPPINAANTHQKETIVSQPYGDNRKSQSQITIANQPLL